MCWTFQRQKQTKNTKKDLEIQTFQGLFLAGAQGLEQGILKSNAFNLSDFSCFLAVFQTILSIKFAVVNCLRIGYGHDYGIFSSSQNTSAQNSSHYLWVTNFFLLLFLSEASTRLLHTVIIRFSKSMCFFHWSAKISPIRIPVHKARITTFPIG